MAVQQSQGSICYVQHIHHLRCHLSSHQEIYKRKVSGLGILLKFLFLSRTPLSFVSQWPRGPKTSLFFFFLLSHMFFKIAFVSYVFLLGFCLLMLNRLTLLYK